MASSGAPAPYSKIPFFGDSAGTGFSKAIFYHTQLRRSARTLILLASLASQ